jgi:hypothetical protein
MKLLLYSTLLGLSFLGCSSSKVTILKDAKQAGQHEVIVAGTNKLIALGALGALESEAKVSASEFCKETNMSYQLIALMTQSATKKKLPKVDLSFKCIKKESSDYNSSLN